MEPVKRNDSGMTADVAETREWGGRRQETARDGRQPPQFLQYLCGLFRLSVDLDAAVIGHKNIVVVVVDGDGMAAGAGGALDAGRDEAQESVGLGVDHTDVPATEIDAIIPGVVPNLVGGQRKRDLAAGDLSYLFPGSGIQDDPAASNEFLERQDDQSSIAGWSTGGGV